MMDKKQDKVLEEYLQGKSGISRRYQSEATQQPAKHVDDAILAAARKSAGSKPHVIHKIYRSDWYKPVSWAAVLVICVSLVFNIYQDSDQELLTAPTPDLSVDIPAAVPMDADIDSTKDAAGQTQAESIPDKEKKITEINAAKPEDIEMIWQQDSKQGEETEVSKPRAAAPVMKKQNMQDKVLRMETIEVPVEKQDEMMSGDEASMSISEEIVPERAKILSRQAEIDDLQMEKLAEPEIMKPDQWLDHINLLWNQGEKEKAIENLKQLLKTYPEYPPEKIKSKLPEELNLSDYLH